MTDSFGFIIRPFYKLDNRLLFAELSPEGKVIGTGFAEIEVADDNKLVLEKDQIVLVNYQLDGDKVCYTVVRSWFVSFPFFGNMINRFPFLARFEPLFRKIMPSSLKCTWIRGEIVQLLNHLFTTVDKENLRPCEEAEVDGRTTQQEGGATTSLPQTS